MEFDHIVMNSIKWLEDNPVFLNEHAKEIEMYTNMIGKNKEFTEAVIDTLKIHPKVLVAIVNLIEQESNPSSKMLKSSVCR